MYDSIESRRYRRLHWELKEAGYTDDDIRAGLAAGKSPAQMLEEAAVRQALADDDGLELRDGAGRMEVFERGALIMWGTLSEIREWIKESANYQESAHESRE